MYKVWITSLCFQDVEFSPPVQVDAVNLHPPPSASTPHSTMQLSQEHL